MLALEANCSSSPLESSLQVMLLNINQSVSLILHLRDGMLFYTDSERVQKCYDLMFLGLPCSHQLILDFKSLQSSYVGCNPTFAQTDVRWMTN